MRFHCLTCGFHGMLELPHVGFDIGLGAFPSGSALLFLSSLKIYNYMCYCVCYNVSSKKGGKYDKPETGC
jgi:hypothetical protein